MKTVVVISYPGKAAKNLANNGNARELASSAIIENGWACGGFRAAK